MRHAHFSAASACRAAAPGLAVFVVAALGVGCPSTIDASASPCTDDSTCLLGQTCAAGQCVDAASLGACTTDLDCDVSQGLVCLDGSCKAPPTTAPASCTDTRECPLADYCNNATAACEPLIDGWCRSSSQCGGALPVCSTDTPARAATCVACVEDGDCAGGQVCGADNTCAGDVSSTSSSSCPPNASLIPGSTTACQCDDGFTPNPTTHTCDAASDPGDDDGTGGGGGGGGGGTAPTTTCVPNASPVPNTTQCKCDPGFVPNAGGSACVPNSSTTPPPSSGGTNPPPSSGGGVAPGGGDDGSTCGPNMIDLFFVCVCDPGFVVNPDAPGCVLGDNDQQDPGGGSVTANDCPANASPNPDDDTTCLCDDGFVVDDTGTACVPGTDTGGTGDGCPANSSADPSDETLCDCDPGFVVDASGTSCVAGSAPPDDGCPENSSPDLDDATLCDCDDGFIVDDSGSACVPDPNAGCPANSVADPTDPESCICDDGFVVDDTGSECVPDPNAGCPANSSVDPLDPSSCQCDDGFVVDDSGTQCVEDVCAVNGYYGDGVCDDFCPFVDPDCE